MMYKAQPQYSPEQGDIVKSYAVLQWLLEGGLVH